MNNELLKTLERELTEITGILVIAGFTEEPEDGELYWIKLAHARVVGLVQGLRIITDAQQQSSNTKDISDEAIH